MTSAEKSLVVFSRVEMSNVDLLDSLLWLRNSQTQQQSDKVKNYRVHCHTHKSTFNCKDTRKLTKILDYGSSSSIIFQRVSLLQCHIKRG